MMNKVYERLSYPIAIIVGSIIAGATAISLPGTNYGEFAGLYLLGLGVYSSTWAICLSPILIISQPWLRRKKLLGQFSTLSVFVCFGVLYPYQSFALCGKEWISIPSSKEMTMLHIIASLLAMLGSMLISVMLFILRRRGASNTNLEPISGSQ